MQRACASNGGLSTSHSICVGGPPELIDDSDPARRPVSNLMSDLSKTLHHAFGRGTEPVNSFEVSMRWQNWPASANRDLPWQAVGFVGD